MDASFQAAFESRDRDALDAVRTEAFERFRALGYPTSKDEEWRFTNVAPIARESFAPGGNGVDPADVARLGLPGPCAARVVFLDGRFRADLSALDGLPEGLRVTPLRDALEDPVVTAHLARHAGFQDRTFVALNTALFTDGVLIHAGRGARCAEPVELLYVTTGGACFPRNLIVLEEGAEAAAVESYASVGEASHLTDAVTECVVAANASLEHYKLQWHCEHGYHVSHQQVHQGRDSRYESHVVTVGGALTRNDIDGVLDAENVSCTLNGLFLIRGSQHVDNHTLLQHRKPHGESHELYKGILQDRSTGVFSGKIHVFEDAQKTDAKQSSANLLLSDEAKVDAKPQLEIYADDVKCTHGATIGQLDENALFYLRARGIPVEAARNILVHAFASDITRRMRLENVRARTEELLTARLPGGSLEG